MKVSVIGGDKRMLFAAKAFSDAGCEVCVSGFDDLKSLCDIRVGSIEEAALFADIAVLPVRPVSEGCLSAPFSARSITIPELMSIIGDKTVFTGCAEMIEPYAVGKVYDYACREDFTYRNAEITAEAALGIIISDYEGSVYGSDILVLGYGRIGKIIVRYLKALGAHVTVAARKLSDRSVIQLFGMNAVDFNNIPYENYNIIFNTVPAQVIDREALGRMSGDVFIIDLASLPGGVDLEAARERELTCIRALSLPGKSAPSAAGMIIKDTIFEIIKEENGGKDYSGLRDDGLLLHLG